jgi:hypothetical protein
MVMGVLTKPLAALPPSNRYYGIGDSYDFIFRMVIYYKIYCWQIRIPQEGSINTDRYKTW